MDRTPKEWVEIIEREIREKHQDDILSVELIITVFNSNINQQRTVRANLNTTTTTKGLPKEPMTDFNRIMHLGNLVDNTKSAIMSIASHRGITIQNVELELKEW